MVIKTDWWAEGPLRVHFVLPLDTRQDSGHVIRRTPSVL